MGCVDANKVAGFPGLASFIASDTDKTTLVFRGFNRLAARNLLHLQAEMASLERALDELDVEDSTSMRSLQYLRNWDQFKQAAENAEPDSRERQRLDLCQKLEDMLKRYREALLQESQLASLPPPTPSIIKVLKSKFAMQDSSGREYSVLGGSCGDLMAHTTDMISLKQPEHTDRLTTFVQEHLCFLFQSGATDADIAYASDRWIHYFVAWISVLLPAILLIGAIIGLYIVVDPVRRLAMIAVFTVLFATGVGLLTNARRAELFAATAAYAAVLVVFVSGDLNCQTCVAPSKSL